MFALNSNQQHPPSPFLSQQEQAKGGNFQHVDAPNMQELPQTEERSRGRGLRRAGNACEICAGAAINSTIIFVFHWMQVHPAGLVLCLITSHLYMTATTLGEGRDRFITNFMSGASAGAAALISLSEPVAEWIEARDHRTESYEAYQTEYVPAQSLTLGGLAPVGLIVAIAIAAISGAAKK